MLNQLRDRIAACGWDLVPEKLVLDGQKQTIKTEHFKGQYIGSINEKFCSLTAWDWLSGRKRTFKVDRGDLTKKELRELREKQEQETRIMEEARLQLHEEKSLYAQEKWDKIRSAQKDRGETQPEPPPYVVEKGLWELLTKLYDATASSDSILGVEILRDHTTDGSLIIPMQDVTGKVWGLQTIDDQGQKTFLDGQRTDGLFHRIGKLDPKGVVYVVEGFATGATIHLCSGRTAVVAFHSENLEPVGSTLRAHYPNLKIVVCGDEDIWKRGPDGHPYFTGRKKSREAAKRCLGSILPVSFENLDQTLVLDKKPTDFNDLLVLGGDRGRELVAAQIEAHYETSPLEYIPTEHTGFHDVVQNKTNPGSRAEPSPEDLRKYFERQHKYRVLGESEIVYIYDKGVYKERPDSYIKAFAESNYQQNDKQVCDNGMAREFVGKVARHHVKPVEWFNSSVSGLINFRNGVLDSRTGVLTPHDPRFGFRYQLNYDYDPDATCPNWDTMMETVTCGDKELETCLDEFTGWIISGDPYWTHHALILLGSGSNGKSTYIDVIRALIGEENATSLTLTDLSHEYNRQLLDGKLACLCEENEGRESTLAASTAFKSLSAGGTTRARAPYKPSYTFQNRAKFIFAFNEFERMPDITHGFKRRLIIATFNAVFHEGKAGHDPNIKEKLFKELPGILNRVGKEYQTAKARGSLTIPSSSRAKVAEIAKESDSVALFAEECVSVPNGEWKTPESRGAIPPNSQSWAGWDEGEPFAWLPDLYTSYHNWCATVGVRYPVSRSRFTRHLIDILGLRKRSGDPIAVRRKDGASCKILRGVSWAGVEKQ